MVKQSEYLEDLRRRVAYSQVRWAAELGMSSGHYKDLIAGRKPIHRRHVLLAEAVVFLLVSERKIAMPVPQRFCDAAIRFYETDHEDYHARAA